MGTKYQQISVDNLSVIYLRKSVGILLVYQNQEKYVFKGF